MNGRAEQVGRVFVSAVSSRPSVAEVWVSTGEGSIHLWLIAREIDADEERSLYRLLDVLDRQFGDVDYQLHVLKPSSYTVPLHDVLPKGAEKVFPGAA